jgi:hypothetical protein
MRPVSLGQSGRAISEAPVWKKSQEAGRPYSLSVRRPPYLVRRSLSVPDTQNRNRNRGSAEDQETPNCPSIPSLGIYQKRDWIAALDPHRSKGVSSDQLWGN